MANNINYKIYNTKGFSLIQNISLYYNIFFIIYYLKPIIKYILIDVVKLRIINIGILYRPKEQLKSITLFMIYDKN